MTPFVVIEILGVHGRTQSRERVPLSAERQQVTIGRGV